MPAPYNDGLEFCGRFFSAAHVAEIIETVTCFPNLSRKELAQTICEHMSWYCATGAYKETACLRLLERLEGECLVTLPTKRSFQRRNNAVVPFSPPVLRGDPLVCSLAAIQPVHLEMVGKGDGLRQWQALINCYHYLGYQKPFGCFIRYLVISSASPVACLQFAGAARAISIRDQWIGWSRQQRLNNIEWVVNNNRLLVFPWVKVKNLASHILGLTGRQIQDAWFAQWGYRPVLMETFVDPAHFSGVSYRAAGWVCLGQTSGVGLVREGKTYKTTPKMMFVKALVPDFRELLCSDKLTGRVIG